MIEKSFLPIDVHLFGDKTGNLYKSLMVAGKRANQITLDIKEELAGKLAEFAPAYDNLEEVMENKEQIEISRFYERKPKSTQTSLEEFMSDQVYSRDPHEDDM
ncbi:MAG: DNA-directed RNA polymerase subunit omega [Bacteroidia bacterium]|nr:DNA-directed RNA polymerase subunit omega [Bacteroidia bacterium]